MCRFGTEFYRSHRHSDHNRNGRRCATTNSPTALWNTSGASDGRTRPQAAPAARAAREPKAARRVGAPARRRSQPARGRRPVRGAVRRRREKAARRRSVMAAQKSGVAAAQRPPRSDARIQSDKIEAFLIKTSKKAFLGRTFYNPQGVSSPLPLRRDARCPPPSQKCGENAVQVLFLCGKDTAGKQNQ